jgi:hypothetical protein
MSITLTTPYAVTINGVQVENDTVGACTGYSVDFIANTMTYFFQIGTLAGSPPNLVAGPIASLQNKFIQVTVNLLTAAWTDNIGGSGVVPGSILNPIIAAFIADRNSAEAFMAVSGGLMPGTVTPWTAL